MKKSFIFAILIICSVVAFGQRRIHDSLVVDQRVRVGTTLVNTDGVQAGTLTTTVATIENLVITGTIGTKTLTVDGPASITGYLNSVGPFYADSSLYFGNDQDNVWMRFAYQEIGTPSSRLVLENLSDVYVQAKNGSSQVAAFLRDTTGPTVKINMPNILYAVQDCTHVGKQLVTDSLGFWVKSADGAFWKLRVSPTGVITMIKSAAP